MQNSVLMDMLFDVNAKPIQATRCLLLVATGVLLLSVSSYMAIYLPYSPVPVSTQTLVVLLIALTYGRRLGASTIGAWLIAGSCGLPVFSYGLHYGIPIFLPTGGYLIGFFAATVLCGYLAEKGWANSFGKLILVLIASHILIYSLGIVQLSLFVKKDLLALGCYPFLIGDIAKSALVVLLLPPVYRWAQKSKA